MIPSEGWDIALIKYIKSRISVKIFLLTMVILMAVSGISYGFVVAFMPRSYSDSLNRTLAARTKQLAESLSGYTLENALSVMEEFSSANQSRVVLLDENGGIVREWNGLEDAPMITSVMEGSSASENDENWTGEQENDWSSSTKANIDELAAESVAIEGTVTSQVDSSEGTVEESASTIETTEADNVQTEEGVSMVEQMEQQAMGHYEVDFKGTDHKYTLFVFGSTQLVNQAVEALGQILPWMLITVFVVSLLIALFYSRYLSKPVRELGVASDKMANLDFSVRTDMKRTDELGVLSRSLDTLAENLGQALSGLREANAKLRDEMEQERELEQRRMEFFSAASHELKTPVTILKGQIEGMEQNVGVYKDRDKYLSRARKVTVTLQNMVQEILMIYRMEFCGFSLKKKEMDLAELVRLQLADLNELFEQKNMELEISLPEKCLCMADPGLMEIVVRNILVNAVRYSPAEERISVKLSKDYNADFSTSNSFLEEISECQNSRETKSMDDTEKILLEVENTGVHINEQDLPRLFDAFYRVDSSRNRKNGGSGLGLYIVREILEQHGAGYKMENTEKGVLFRMKLI